MEWIVVAAIAAVVIYDLARRRHPILRNFPIIGHFHYLLESIGPELRQYIVTDNDEERPFSRDQRHWVHASSKRQNPNFGVGSDNDMELSPNCLIIKHSAFPVDAGSDDPRHSIACKEVLGGPRDRAGAFRPESLVNVSGMSFGSLSGPAIEALNRGARAAGCLHNTGEGSVSAHHLQGGDLVLQLGTGYFGCRDAAGRFSLKRLEESLARGRSGPSRSS